MRTTERHVTFFDAYAHLYAGTNRSMHLLAERLPSLGYTAEIVVTRHGIYEDRLRSAGVDVTVIDAPPALSRYGKVTTRGRAATSAVAALPAYWAKVARHLRKRGGVVLACSPRAVLLSAPAARLARRPFIWQVAVIEESPPISIVCDLLANRTVLIAGVLRVPSLTWWRHQDVVTHPLDPRFEAVPAVEPAAPPVIVTVARLEPMKNLPVLIDAMATLHREFPDVRLRVVGPVQEGHERYAEGLIEHRDRLGLQDTVEFIGWAERPEDHWHDATVYVQPSVLEGLGLAIVEAMACRLPVVFTSPIGLTESVENGVSALVVPPNDVAAMADAIARVLRDPALADRLGEEGRKVALRRFSLDNVATATAALYDEVITCG